MKAFDGPPLKSGDVKDLFLRNFGVRLSTAEAKALIVHFISKKVSGGKNHEGPVSKYLLMNRYHAQQQHQHLFTCAGASTSPNRAHFELLIVEIQDRVVGVG